eukprot:Skav209107  [mRNA]  locus=scaffold179:162758:165381:+ [translate_table: standard]
MPPWVPVGVTTIAINPSKATCRRISWWHAVRFADGAPGPGGLRQSLPPGIGALRPGPTEPPGATRRAFRGGVSRVWDGLVVAPGGTWLRLIAPGGTWLNLVEPGWTWLKMDAGCSSHGRRRTLERDGEADGPAATPSVNVSGPMWTDVDRVESLATFNWDVTVW